MSAPGCGATRVTMEETHHDCLVRLVAVLCWCVLCAVLLRQVERLVCGNPNLDFEALERNSKYEGGFSVATPAVQWLWQVGRRGQPAVETIVSTGLGVRCAPV